MDRSKLPRPDSERLSELVPDSMEITNDGALVIGQESALMAMLRVHITCYSRRTRNIQLSPEEVIHPLQESLFTGDGGVFSLAYLGMVEKFVLRVNEQLGRDPQAERDLTLMAAIAPILYPGDTPREPLEMMQGCLNELRRARSVFEVMTWDDERGPEVVVREFIVRGAYSGLKIDLSKHARLEEVLNSLPKPVFLNFTGFPGVSWRDESLCRQRFLEIVKVVRLQVCPRAGVYYSFRGRVSFLKDCGMPTREGRFARIHLNPLTEMNIWELIDRTRRGGQRMDVFLQELYKSRTLDEIVSELHRKTDGHGFMVRRALYEGHALSIDQHPDERHIKWLQANVEKFPEAIEKHLLARRNDRDIDLEEIVEYGDGRVGTVGYLAIQIHAGIGPYSRSSPIIIPASLLQYMEGRFWSFSDYCKEAVSRISNRETLIEILMRFFQAVFKEEKSWGEAMGDFLNRTCSLWDMRLQLDVRKHKDERKIEDEAFFLGLHLGILMDDQQVEVFRSNRASVGPDFFLLDRLKRMVVAVNLVVEPLSLRVVEDKARRYELIEQGILSKMESTRSFLMLCVLGSGLDPDTIPRIVSRVEVVVVNLSRPDLRRNFFKSVIPAENQDRIVSIIEELIARRID